MNLLRSARRRFENSQEVCLGELERLAGRPRLVNQTGDRDRVAGAPCPHRVLQGGGGRDCGRQLGLRTEDESVPARRRRPPDQVEFPEGTVQNIVDAAPFRAVLRRVGAQQGTHVLLQGRATRRAPIGSRIKLCDDRAL